MKTKKQIFIVHGGYTFRNRKDYIRMLKTRKIDLSRRKHWRDEYLDKELGKTHEIIRPRMPLKDYAQYEDWKIHFERHFPYLRNGIILIGESLGGIFLAKYLSEHKFPKKISATYLVCPPFDDTIRGERLAGGFKLKRDLAGIQRNSPNLTLMFSEDDPIIPLTQAEKYRGKLPSAKIVIYKSKNGHFRVEKFPEIVKMIRAL